MSPADSLVVSGNRSLDEFTDVGGSGGSNPSDGDAEDDHGGVAAETAAGGAASESGAASTSEAPADASGVATGGGADSVGAEPVGVPDSTYVWHPEGRACASCGSTAEERWRQDGALVCGDCKEW